MNFNDLYKQDDRIVPDNCGSQDLLLLHNYKAANYLFQISEIKDPFLLHSSVQAVQIVKIFYVQTHEQMNETVPRRNGSRIQNEDFTDYILTNRNLCCFCHQSWQQYGYFDLQV